MQFANPLFLFALVSVAIPIAIHLFNFRRFKRVYFTNVHLLSELQQETKKRSQIKQLLILLTRILALVALVFAFSQPFIPHEKQAVNKPGRHAVTVYVDNSFSMEGIGEEGTLLDMAKIKAKEVVEAYTPSDLFQLVTNDFKGTHQRFVTPEEFLKTLEEVVPTPASRKISVVISRQNDCIGIYPELQHDAFLISDFQKSTTDLAVAKPDTGMNWYFIPVQSQQRDNVYIDSVWFPSPVHQPNQITKMMVRIRNLGPAKENAPIKLTINNTVKAIASFNVQANSLVDIELSYSENEAGQQLGVVSITDHPILTDDSYYLTYPILPSIPVLCINEQEGNKYLNAMFDGDSIFTFTNITRKKIDYSTLSSFSLILLNEIPTITSGLSSALTQFVKEGGSLAIFPPPKGEIPMLNMLTRELHCGAFGQIDTNRQKITSLILESEFFSNVFENNAITNNTLPDNTDLPIVFQHYTLLSPDSGFSEPLMVLENGNPFLHIKRLGSGTVYLFSAPLDPKWTTFPQHLLIVPVLYRMALLSTMIPPLAYLAGDHAIVRLPSDTSTTNPRYSITDRGSGFEVIPEQRLTTAGISLLTHGQISESGFYQIEGRSGPISAIAFNYDRVESDLTITQNEELHAEIARAPFQHAQILTEKQSTISRQIEQVNQGIPLWKWFIILTLFSLALEIIFIRFLKSQP